MDVNPKEVVTNSNGDDDDGAIHAKVFGLNKHASTKAQEMTVEYTESVDYAQTASRCFTIVTCRTSARPMLIIGLE